MHDVAVVDQAVDERAGHDFIAEDLAPLVEALIGRQDRRRGFLAAQHAPRSSYGQKDDHKAHQYLGCLGN